mmetsp:Transcript_84789/g.267482  ORF Transcript_84789/g.267482 Transcript_84789/m.267482 type:complete len:284 (-) Transcript_84789:536-1387(-)
MATGPSLPCWFSAHLPPPPFGGPRRHALAAWPCAPGPAERRLARPGRSGRCSGCARQRGGTPQIRRAGGPGGGLSGHGRLLRRAQDFQGCPRRLALRARLRWSARRALGAAGLRRQPLGGRVGVCRPLARAVSGGLPGQRGQGRLAGGREICAPRRSGRPRHGLPGREQLLPGRFRVARCLRRDPQLRARQSDRHRLSPRFRARVCGALPRWRGGSARHVRPRSSGLPRAEELRLWQPAHGQPELGGGVQGGAGGGLCVPRDLPPRPCPPFAAPGHWFCGHAP